MDEARLGPDALGQGAQEGDDVVLRLALDLGHARQIDAGAPDLGYRFLRYLAVLGPRLATAISTRSHSSILCSSDQIAPISGRV